MDRERVVIVDIGENVQFDSGRVQTGVLLTNEGRTARRFGGASLALGATRVMRPRSAGKLYARFRIDQSSPAGVLVGLARPELPANGGLNIGSDANGWSYANDGYVWHAGVPVSVGVTASAGDIIDLAVDLDSGKLWFGRDGAWFSGNPASGAAPLFTNVTGATYLAFSAYILSGSVTLLVDDAQIRATCPEGFTPYGILARVASRGFATAPGDIPSSVYYEGCIAPDGDPVYDRRVTCVAWEGGQRKGAPLGDMELINIEGTFDYLLNYETKNAPVRVRRGFVGDPVFGTFVECAAARIKRIQFLNEERARVVFADPGAELEKNIPRAVFGSSTPNTTLINTPQPLALGINRWVVGYALRGVERCHRVARLRPRVRVRRPGISRRRRCGMEPRYG